MYVCTCIYAYMQGAALLSIPIGTETHSCHKRADMSMTDTHVNDADAHICHRHTHVP